MLLRQYENVDGFFAGFCVELSVGSIPQGQRFPCLALALARALDVECQNQS